MPELGSIGRRAAAGLAGLAPHIHQSGMNPGRAHIGGGRPCVRAALYMTALSAVRSNSAFKQTYKDMRDKAKPAKIALVAVARKIITIANALAKADQSFSKNSHQLLTPQHSGPDACAARSGAPQTRDLVGRIAIRR